MKHLKQAPLVALIALSLSTSACEVALLAASLSDDDNDTDTGFGDDGDGEAGFVSTEGNTKIEAANFSGSIGDVVGISTDAQAVAFFDGEYASITLTTLTDEWGAMVAFDFSGADADSFFTPGSVITLSADSLAFSFACSGDENDPYAYETSQSSGVISVAEAEGGDMLQVDFQVQYGAGTDAVTGSFQIEAP